MARYTPHLLDTDNVYPNSNMLSSVNPTAVSSSGDYDAVELFRNRLNRLKSTENEKDKLIEELLQRLEMTEGHYQRLALDHERETNYNREQQKRETQLQKQLRTVKNLTDRNAFVVVLLDGDGMIFNNDYLRQGERGGKEAASHLWSAMDTFIKQELSHLSSPIVIGRVYGNVRGLGEVLQKSGIIDYASQFDDFARGFNGSKLLFDFVDVGSGKDKADDKITEIFKLYLRDIHCHQLVLGCSHDNGYARLLEDIMGDSNFLERITLLEGVPFERELADLQRQFRTTKFNDLFRGSKVVAPSQYRAGPTAPLPSLLPDSRNTSPAPAPAVARQKSKSDELAAPTANASAAPVSWASKTAAPYTPSPSETELANKSNAGSANRATTTINRNRHGQRIDDLDTYIHNDDIKRIKRLKLCNVYYLIGPDACNNPRCNHDHEWPITKNDLRVLRQVARMAPCDYGTECDDPGCIYGHRCPQNNPNADSCFFGNDCWFAGWGHGIDTKICKTIKI